MLYWLSITEHVGSHNGRFSTIIALNTFVTLYHKLMLFYLFSFLGKCPKHIHYFNYPLMEKNWQIKQTLLVSLLLSTRAKSSSSSVIIVRSWDASTHQILTHLISWCILFSSVLHMIMELWSTLFPFPRLKHKIVICNKWNTMMIMIKCLLYI